MSVYQKDIKRIMKQLLLVYETKITYDKSRKIERIGSIEYTILEYIAEHEHVVTNDLLNRIPIKRTKLLSIVKKLCDEKFIEKIDNPNDKRSSYLCLAHKGEQFLANFGEHESVFLDFVLKDMTINEEKAIVKFLSKIQQTSYMK